MIRCDHLSLQSAFGMGFIEVVRVVFGNIVAIVYLSLHSLMIFPLLLNGSHITTGPLRG